MHRISIVSVSVLALLSSVAGVPHCSGMQRPEPQVTLQTKDTSFATRRAAVPSEASDLDLLQKGYVRIGSVSAKWPLTPAEVDPSREAVPAVVAEARQMMAKAAAASGGDLIGKLRLGTDSGFGTKLKDECRDVTIPGKEKVITTYKRDGSFEQRHETGKSQTVRECKPVDVTDFDRPIYSLQVEAAVWRLEPEIARQLIAASEGNETAIQAAEANGFTVPRSSLFMAIEAGDISRVTQLLNRGARLNVLLPDGGEPTSKRRRRATPLHWAAFADQTQVARFLLDRGADANARDSAGHTPLQYALWPDKSDMEKSHPVAELLLARGANPNVYGYGVLDVDMKDHETPLHLAIRAADVEMVRALLEHGADRSLKNGSGETALGFARSWRSVAFKFNSLSGNGGDKVNKSIQIVELLSSPVVSASSGGWKQYAYAEDRFSIASPVKPDSQEASQGNLETRTYNIALEGGRSLLLSVTDTRQGDRLKPNRALPATRDSFVKSLNVKVISAKEIRLVEHPGIEFEAQGAQWHVKSRIYAVRGMLFHLVSIGPANMPLAPETDRFFDSLTLLPGPG